MSDYDLGHHSLCIIGGAAMADEEEIKDTIKYLNEMIGTGYYDGEGDELLSQIVNYLSAKLNT